MKLCIKAKVLLNNIQKENFSSFKNYPACNTYSFANPIDENLLDSIEVNVCLFSIFQFLIH